MKIVDIHDPTRVNRSPDKVKVLFSSDRFQDQGVSIKRVEMRLYLEKHDKNLGTFSLITSFVDTDIGSIEMLYDEGFRGDSSLERAVEFLTTNLGLSGLILRSIIALKNKINDSK